MASSAETRPHINLQLGWPTPSLFPREQLAYSAQTILLDEDVAAKALVYGPDPGQDSLRITLATWLSSFYQPSAGSVSPGNLFITNGASAALGMLLTQFTDPAYTRRIWMVEPTYFLACTSFQEAGFDGKMKGVPEDNEGIDTAYLRRGLLEAESDYASPPGFRGAVRCPKVYKHVIYVVPTFSNPSGKIMSVGRRRELVELAREFDALIIADDVYDWLRWPAEGAPLAVSGNKLPPPPPRLVDVDRSLPGTTLWGNAVSNGSFSKIVAPGVRVGWVEGSSETSKALCKVGSVRSGGCQGHLSSMFMGHLISSGALNRHLQDKLVPTYQERCRVMRGAIQEHLLPLGMTVVRGKDDDSQVQGGFFLYLRLPPGSVSGKDFAELALQHYNLRVAHGGMMTVSGDSGSTERAGTTFGSCLRLCWAWHDAADIEEGIKRIASAFKHKMEPTKEMGDVNNN